MDDSPIRKRTGFLYFWWVAILVLVIIGIGEFLSRTGERWIPEIGGIEWALILVLLFALGAIKILADEVFPPEEEQDE